MHICSCDVLTYLCQNTFVINSNSFNFNQDFRTFNIHVIHSLNKKTGVGEKLRKVVTTLTQMDRTLKICHVHFIFILAL